jgi:RNA polymerase sigma factor (sigma-70 family)
MLQKELDGRLDRLVPNSDRYTRRVEKLAAELDSKGFDLEIAHPESWRKLGSRATEPSRFSLDNQLRHDIESIRTMDREEEARLARRIEFARLRLKNAMNEAGLSSQDIEGGVSSTPTAFLVTGQAGCALPPKVCRRWSELHALRTEMVERNLYLALINVERYAHTSAGRADLIQEGSAALFRAVDGYDWRRGLLFRTYAVHWLNQAFRSYLYNFGHTVRVPVYLQKALKHIHLAIVRLGDPNASAEQISKETGLGENLVTAALAAARGIRSIDAPSGDGDEGTGLQNTLRTQDDGGPYATDLEDVSLSEALGEALDQLSDRERHVVSLRFGLAGERAYTLAEVADRLGVSLERIRQIQVRAISKMRTRKLRSTAEPFLN